MPLESTQNPPPGSAPEIPGLAAIREAAAGLAGRIHRTPLEFSDTFSRLASSRVHLKAEQLQKTGSFKVRGALNFMSRLAPEDRARGVVTISAGNHAQAVAFAAAQVGASATVVMMQGASPVKLEATRAYGARVEMVPDALVGFERVKEIAAAEGRTFVPPFDHPWTVAGSATVGLEIAEDLPQVDWVVVGVGGGGLSSGVALSIRALCPKARIVGVEPEGAPTLSRALAEGQVVRLGPMDTVADGLAAPFAGELNLRILRETIDRVITIPDSEILAAVRLLLERSKMMVEPAGAAALGALLAGHLPESRDSNVAVILSGGNVSLNMLSKWFGGPGNAAA